MEMDVVDFVAAGFAQFGERLGEKLIVRASQRVASVKTS
jgi:hypothetical protein